MLKSILILGAVAGLVVAGVVEGLRTNRWGESEGAATATAGLTAIPASFGDWVSTDRKMDPRIQRIAGATGYMDRHYRNQKTGQVVDVLMLCGPSGSIAAHTPDICFAGIGYAMKEPTPVRRNLSVPSMEPMTYWSARFEKDGPNYPTLLVNWAWGVHGEWSASEAPRREFMLQHSLYKLYVTKRVAETDKDAIQAAAAVDMFMTEFLPRVKVALAEPG